MIASLFSALALLLAPPCQLRAGGALPDPVCTPGGVFRDASKAEVCVVGFTIERRRVLIRQRRLVFARYGIPYSRRHRYQFDHLVPLAIGGSNSNRNLWPMPLRYAKRKDVVEVAIRVAVCMGTYPYREAQRNMARDWRVA